jgi:membrane-bound lytic murein transglycosylase MltF
MTSMTTFNRWRSWMACGVLIAVPLVNACSRSQDAPSQDAPSQNTAPATAAGEEPLPQVESPYDVLPEEARAHLNETFTGDLDAMVRRRLIRAGVAYSRTHYFVDKGVQRGIAYESLKLFEDELNKRLKTGKLKVNVFFVPMPRDLLLPALVDGKVDLVAAMLTVTPERQKLVDFTRPTRTGVREIVVTGPGVPAVKTIDDLAGRDVFVRRSGSYYDSLTVLNTKLEAQNRPPVTIKLAPEVLEDDDILEMVNAGLVGVTIVDDYIAEFWRQIFTGLTLHPDIAVRSGGTLAVAVRKNNPKLKAAGNIWIDEYGPRTMFGNTVNRRYLENTSYARSATSEQERKKFQSMVQIFRRYGEQYDLDFVMMAAQGYQESRLDQSVRSPVGAIGVMQVMPSTGKELGVGDIRQLEPNIHAGVKYIRFIIDEYFKGEPMDDGNKLLFAFASYNVGPGRIGQLRRETARRGLDPNRWFGNVEQVASERIGREPVQYVSNIYKYYVAYRLVLEQATQRNELKQSPAPAVKR